MTNFYRTLFLLSCFVLSVTTVFGQQPAEKTIRGPFTNLSFEQFVREVETQTEYRFFYNPRDVDSVRVNYDK
jgi:hypothetical protein